jgi:hypothetical protein
MTSNFYRHLYTSKGVQGMEEVLNVVPVKVSSLIMNQGLDAPL